MKRILPYLSLLVLSIASAAEEVTHNDKILSALQAEPLSLFDWGLYSLEEELQSVRRHERDFIRVSFDPPNNKIIVDGVFFVDANEIEAINAQRTCYKRHHAIKLTLGIIDTDRINLAPAAEFRLGLKFSHRDADSYPDQPDAEQIGKHLMNMIHIKVGVGSNVDQFPFLQDMRCDGALLSQEVNYGADVSTLPNN
ncbi:MAG: hypothetical protein AAF387_05955 [Pseudomonadota bacterium]